MTEALAIALGLLSCVVARLYYLKIFHDGARRALVEAVAELQVRVDQCEDWLVTGRPPRPTAPQPKDTRDGKLPPPMHAPPPPVGMPRPWRKTLGKPPDKVPPPPPRPMGDGIYHCAVCQRTIEPHAHTPEEVDAARPTPSSKWGGAIKPGEWFEAFEVGRLGRWRGLRRVRSVGPPSRSVIDTGRPAR